METLDVGANMLLLFPLNPVYTVFVQIDTMMTPL